MRKGFYARCYNRGCWFTNMMITGVICSILWKVNLSFKIIMDPHPFLVWHPFLWFQLLLGAHHWKRCCVGTTLPELLSLFEAFLHLTTHASPSASLSLLYWKILGPIHEIHVKMFSGLLPNACLSFVLAVIFFIPSTGRSWLDRWLLEKLPCNSFRLCVYRL